MKKIATLLFVFLLPSLLFADDPSLKKEIETSKILPQATLKEITALIDKIETQMG